MQRTVAAGCADATHGTPPTEARPTQLSVTQVESLIRDPYAIYARHILALRPLDPIDSDPGAADRGTIIHGVLDEFITAHPKNLPPNAEQALLDIGHQHFESHMSRPGIRAFWWPRFQRIAAWFIDNERRRRDAGWRTVATEVDGVRIFDGLQTPFTLKARADRIDARPNVGLAIIDYKTGKCAVGDWVGERPKEPQLLLYLLASGQAPTALAFAQVRPGDCAYVGLGESGSVPGVRTDVARVVGEKMAAQVEGSGALDNHRALRWDAYCLRCLDEWFTFP